MNSFQELEFVVFVIESVASRLGITGDAAYRLLTEGADVLDSYVIPSYDVLHTQGKSYIVDDVLQAMRKAEAVR